MGIAKVIFDDGSEIDAEGLSQARFDVDAQKERVRILQLKIEELERMNARQRDTIIQFRKQLEEGLYGEIKAACPETRPTREELEKLCAERQDMIVNLQGSVRYWKNRWFAYQDSWEDMEKKLKVAQDALVEEWKNRIWRVG